MEVSRRNMGAIALAATLVSCTSTSTAAGVQPSVLDVLQKAVAAVCPIIPAAVTLVGVIVAKFPAASGVGTITETLANEISQYVCALFQPAVASGKLGGTEDLSAMVGGTSVPLHGFHVVNGKLVGF